MAVVLTNALFIACLLVASLQLRRMLPQEGAVDRLALAFGAAIVSSGVVVADNDELGWLWVVPTHGGIFVAHAAMWSAVWARVGRPPPWGLVGATAIALALSLVLAGFEPSARAERVALASATYAVGFALATVQLYRGHAMGGPSRPMDRVAGTFFGILAACMAAGAAWGLGGISVVDVWLYTLVVFPSLFAAGGLCLLLGYVDDTLSASRRLAETDALTGIANRHGFEAAASEELRQGQAGGQPVVLVVADVDGLKAINDSFGHPMGDAVIRAAAAALRHESGPRERLARLGGDEFGLLVPGVTSTRVEARLQRAQTVLRQLAPSELRAQLSFGLAEQRPGETIDYATLYASADDDLLVRRAKLRAIA